MDYKNLFSVSIDLKPLTTNVTELIGLLKKISTANKTFAGDFTKDLSNSLSSLEKSLKSIGKAFSSLEAAPASVVKAMQALEVLQRKTSNMGGTLAGLSGRNVKQRENLDTVKSTTFGNEYADNLKKLEEALKKAAEKRREANQALKNGNAEMNRQLLSEAKVASNIAKEILNTNDSIFKKAQAEIKHTEQLEANIAKLKTQISPVTGFVPKSDFHNITGGQGLDYADKFAPKVNASQALQDKAEKVLGIEKQINDRSAQLSKLKLEYEKTNDKLSLEEKEKTLAKILGLQKENDKASETLTIEKNRVIRREEQETATATEKFHRSLNKPSSSGGGGSGGGAGIADSLFSSAALGVFLYRLSFATTAVSGFFNKILTDTYNTEKEFDKFRVSLLAITRDTVRAQELFQLSKTVSLHAPFNIEEVQKATQIITAFGQQAEVVLPKVVDLAAALGKDLESAATAVSYALAGSTNGFRRLRQTFAITNEEIKKFGGVLNRTNGILLDNEEHINQNRQALLRLIDAKYQGVSEARINSLQGSITVLQDAIQHAQDSVAKAFVPSVINMIHTVTEAVNSFNKLSGGTKDLIFELTIAAALFTGVTAALTVFGTALAPLLRFTGATGVFSLLNTDIGVLYATIGGASAEVAAASTLTLSGAFTALAATITAAIASISIAFAASPWGVTAIGVLAIAGLVIALASLAKGFFGVKNAVVDSIASFNPLKLIYELTVQQVVDFNQALDDEADAVNRSAEATQKHVNLLNAQKSAAEATAHGIFTLGSSLEDVIKKIADLRAAGADKTNEVTLTGQKKAFQSQIPDVNQAFSPDVSGAGIEILPYGKVREFRDTLKAKLKTTSGEEHAQINSEIEEIDKLLGASSSTRKDYDEAQNHILKGIEASVKVIDKQLTDEQKKRKDLNEKLGPLHEIVERLHESDSKVSQGRLKVQEDIKFEEKGSEAKLKDELELLADSRIHLDQVRAERDKLVKGGEQTKAGDLESTYTHEAANIHREIRKNLKASLKANFNELAKQAKTYGEEVALTATDTVAPFLAVLQRYAEKVEQTKRNLTKNIVLTDLEKFLSPDKQKKLLYERKKKYLKETGYDEIGLNEGVKVAEEEASKFTGALNEHITEGISEGKNLNDILKESLKGIGEFADKLKKQGFGEAGKKLVSKLKSNALKPVLAGEIEEIKQQSKERILSDTELYNDKLALLKKYGIAYTAEIKKQFTVLERENKTNQTSRTISDLKDQSSAGVISIIELIAKLKELSETRGQTDAQRKLSIEALREAEKKANQDSVQELGIQLQALKERQKNEEITAELRVKVLKRLLEEAKGNQAAEILLRKELITAEGDIQTELLNARKKNALAGLEIAKAGALDQSRFEIELIKKRLDTEKTLEITQKKILLEELKKLETEEAKRVVELLKSTIQQIQDIKLKSGQAFKDVGVSGIAGTPYGGIASDSRLLELQRTAQNATLPEEQAAAGGAFKKLLDALVEEQDRATQGTGPEEHYYASYEAGRAKDKLTEFFQKYIRDETIKNEQNSQQAGKIGKATEKLLNQQDETYKKSFSTTLEAQIETNSILGKIYEALTGHPLGEKDKLGKPLQQFQVTNPLERKGIKDIAGNVTNLTGAANEKYEPARIKRNNPTTGKEEEVFDTQHSVGIDSEGKQSVVNTADVINARKKQPADRMNTRQGLGAYETPTVDEKNVVNNQTANVTMVGILQNMNATLSQIKESSIFKNLALKEGSLSAFISDSSITAITNALANFKSVQNTFGNVSISIDHQNITDKSLETAITGIVEKVVSTHISSAGFNASLTTAGQPAGGGGR